MNVKPFFILTALLSASALAADAGSFPSVPQSSVSVQDSPAVTKTDVGLGYSGTSVNTAIFRNSSVASLGDVQYTAFYDPDGYLTLAKRQLPDGAWTVRRSDLKGNIRDGHNVISIGVDGKGYLHVSYDHHGHPLRYAVSDAPGSLNLLSVNRMLGDDEHNVTYPEFYRLADGNLIFVYRSGSSGRGNLVMNRYDVGKGEWERVQSVLIDGENARNAYWQLFIDPSGRMHLSWVWRETWLVETNHDLCYAYSDDGGKTWRKSDGTAYSLPINASNAEVAFSIPQNSELINQTGMAADSDGNPYIATYWRDADSRVPQYRVVWNDGKGNWNSRVVFERKTPFSLSGGGTKMIPIARPRVVADGDFVAMLFRDEERGSKASMAYSVNGPSGDWIIIDLTGFSTGAWEPSFDIDRWNASRLIDVFVQPTSQGDGEKAVSAEPTMVSIYEIDINKLKK